MIQKKYFIIFKYHTTIQLQKDRSIKLFSSLPNAIQITKIFFHITDFIC